MNTIISIGGTDVSFDRFNKFYKKGDYIIGVDSGSDFLYKNKIIPNLIIGDFDSIDKKIFNKYKTNKQIKIKKFPKNKDKTDGELALEEAKKIKSNKIMIFGVNKLFNIDHFLANIFLLSKYKNAIIITEKEIIFYLQKNNFTLYRKLGKRVSFLPITKIKIILKGFIYSGFFESNISKTLTLRNKLSSNIGKINLLKGKIFIVQTKD